MAAIDRTSSAEIAPHCFARNVMSSESRSNRAACTLRASRYCGEGVGVRARQEAFDGVVEPVCR